MHCEIVKKVESHERCPFRKGPACTARDDYIGKCNPEPGRRFPRRCPLRRGPVAVIGVLGRSL